MPAVEKISGSKPPGTPARSGGQISPKGLITTIRTGAEAEMIVCLQRPCQCDKVVGMDPQELNSAVEGASQRYEQQVLRLEEQLHAEWIAACRANIGFLVAVMRKRGMHIVTADPPEHDPEGQLCDIVTDMIKSILQLRRKGSDGWSGLFPERVQNIWARHDWQALSQEIVDRALNKDTESEDTRGSPNIAV